MFRNEMRAHFLHGISILFLQNVTDHSKNTHTCWTSRILRSSNPPFSALYTWVPLIMTVWAGRLTPQAKVAVQQRHLMRPAAKASSTMLRSERRRPAWWIANPHLMKLAMSLEVCDVNIYYYWSLKEPSYGKKSLALLVKKIMFLDILQRLVEMSQPIDFYNIYIIIFREIFVSVG
jgi:hypothetical protein